MPGQQGSKTAPGPLVNPFASNAHVTAERIDQGVDYAGIGSLVAIASGIITKVLSGASSGWPGNYIEYKVTDPKSPLKGQSIYYAEGVTSTVKVGQKVNAGQVIANLIPGWHSGIELGYAAGVGSESYAMAHGGYSEGQLTASGQAFSDLVGGLGGPAGLAEGRKPVGSAPPGVTVLGTIGAGGPASTITPFPSALDQATKGPLGVIGAIGGFISNPVPALLTVLFVGLGAVLLFSGVGRMLGFNAPVASAVGRVAGAAKVAGEAG